MNKTAKPRIHNKSGVDKRREENNVGKDKYSCMGTQGSCFLYSGQGKPLWYSAIWPRALRKGNKGALSISGEMQRSTAGRTAERPRGKWLRMKVGGDEDREGSEQEDLGNHCQDISFFSWKNWETRTKGVEWPDFKSIAFITLAVWAGQETDSRQRHNLGSYGWVQMSVVHARGWQRWKRVKRSDAVCNLKVKLTRWAAREERTNAWHYFIRV